MENEKMWDKFPEGEDPTRDSQLEERKKRILEEMAKKEEEIRKLKLQKEKEGSN